MVPTRKSSQNLEQVFRSNQKRTIGPLEKLLCDLRPEIEDLFVLHSVPPEVAERILRETLQALAWKWEAVRNRQAWLLAILERKCACLADGTEQQPWDGLG